MSHIIIPTPSKSTTQAQTLKLEIFPFTCLLVSSLFVVNNVIASRGFSIACTRTAVQHPCRIHKHVLGTRYSGTVIVARLAPITVCYVQLHIDDAIVYIMMT